MFKNLIIGPAKLAKVSPEGNFKDSITRKRWLGAEVEVNPLFSGVRGHFIFSSGKMCVLDKFARPRLLSLSLFFIVMRGIFQVLGKRRRVCLKK